nr:unnamed protein product [Digitaria exilis]
MAESAAPKTDAAAAGRKTRVGPYEVGKTIGEGSFAKVKHARDSRTGAVRAIKVLDRNHVLRHKMVEQVMASKTKIYMVLEFVDGGELFDKIVNSGRLSEDEARKYFHQLINAVDYCHSRGVYHRDLKPENLLLDSHGTLKVSDFGLSAFAPQTKVLADKGYNGMAADVWSCGIILFVLMAGYLPFDDSNLMKLYKMICQANVSCPPWFSPGAKKFIKRIMDPNPDTRITIAEILQDEWFKKDYKPPRFEQGEDVSLDDVDAAFKDSEEHLVSVKREKPESMNAFALISRSQGFNLGNLFEKEMMMKLKGDKTGRKGHLSVATEVFEVAPSLHMVELRKTGGDTLEFHNFYKNFSSELKDIVWKAESDLSKKQTK